MSDSKVWLNFRQLLTGRALSAVFSLGATACMARALGPAEFGLVVLLHTYVVTVRSLLNIKPAVAFVKFGVPLMDAGNVGQVNQLLGFIRSVEWVSMLVATLAALLLVPVVGSYFGWSDDVVVAAMLYSMVLLASPVGTARGFCRATERFDLLRSQLAIGPFVRLAGVLFAWWQNLTWHYYAAAWALGMVVSYGYLWWRGSKLMRSCGYKPSFFRWRKANERFPGLVKFQKVVYMQGNLDVLPRHLITLLVGALLGPASAGLFGIARELTDILGKPVQLIRQAAFTELTRLSEAGVPDLGKVFHKYGLNLLAPVCAVIAVAGVWHEEILTGVAGNDYASAGSLFMLLLIAAAIDLVGAILRPLAYSVGLSAVALNIQWVASFAYIAIFVALSQLIGINSVGLAACAAALFSIFSLGYSLRDTIAPKAKVQLS